MKIAAGLALALALAAPALAGQYTYQSDVNGSRWHLIEEPCRDPKALAFVPPRLRTRAMHGTRVWTVAGTGTYSFCWLLTKKGEVVLVWPDGHIGVEALHQYRRDRGI